MLKIKEKGYRHYLYSMKLDLLTNATVVDDAIRFVSGKSIDRNILRNEHENRAITNQTF
jgi:hypothetical protein